MKNSTTKRTRRTDKIRKRGIRIGASRNRRGIRLTRTFMVRPPHRFERPIMSNNMSTRCHHTMSRMIRITRRGMNIISISVRKRHHRRGTHGTHGRGIRRPTRNGRRKHNRLSFATPGHHRPNGGLCPYKRQSRRNTNRGRRPRPTQYTTNGRIIRPSSHARPHGRGAQCHRGIMTGRQLTNVRQGRLQRRPGRQRGGRVRHQIQMRPRGILVRRQITPDFEVGGTNTCNRIGRRRCHPHH